MSGGRAPSYTGDLLLLKKKNKIRAAAETATTPPATPPAMAPTLEEEPPELDEGDEVEETVCSDDEMEEGVEAATVEVGTKEDVDLTIPLIIAPGSTSGVSERGNVPIEDDRVM
jgi:hypothetical protein